MRPEPRGVQGCPALHVVQGGLVARFWLLALFLARNEIVGAPGGAPQFLNY